MNRLLILVLIALAAPILAAEDVPLTNPSFDGGLTERGVPTGWSQYAGGPGQSLSLVKGANGQGLLIVDGSAAAEIGVTQSVPVKPDTPYKVSVQVAANAGASTAGAQLQLRFQPSNKFVQVPLVARGDGFSEVAAYMTAPPDAKTATIYLYCHKEPTPQVIVDDVRLQSGV